MGSNDGGLGGPPPANEPFAGYSDADVETIEDVIADAPEGPQRESLKSAIRDAEFAADGEPRKGVLAATEPTSVAPPPPPPSPGDSAVSDEDTSGRPDLASVAEERAASVKERVIDTLTPKQSEED